MLCVGAVILHTDVTGCLYMTACEMLCGDEAVGHFFARGWYPPPSPPQMLTYAFRGIRRVISKYVLTWHLNVEAAWHGRGFFRKIKRLLLFFVKFKNASVSQCTLYLSPHFYPFVIFG